MVTSCLPCEAEGLTVTRTTLIQLVVALSCAGCGQPGSPTSPAPSAQPKADAGDIPTEPGAQEPELYIWDFYTRPQSYGSPCVFVGPAADKDVVLKADRAMRDNPPQRLPERLLPCFETPEALREAHPQLHRKTTAMSLAASLVHLANPELVDAPQLVRKHRDPSGSKLLGPFDLGEHALWIRDAPHERTPHDDLMLPAFSKDGDSLTYDVSTVTRPEPEGFVVVSERITVVFSDTAWTKTSKVLPREDLQAPLIKQAEEGMGGSVAALMGIPVEGGDWYVAFEPEGEASPFAWRGTGDAVVGYASMAALLEANPAIGTPEGKLALAKVLNKHLFTGSFHPIRDASAWQDLYLRSGQDVLKQRAYNQGYYDEYVHYTVQDFASISDPSFEGDVFTVYLEGSNKQPYRASVDLSALAVGQTIEPEFMATWTTSEHDGPMPPPMPAPAPAPG